MPAAGLRSTVLKFSRPQWSLNLYQLDCRCRFNSHIFEKVASIAMRCVRVRASERLLPCMRTGDRTVSTCEYFDLIGLKVTVANNEAEASAGTLAVAPLVRGLAQEPPDPRIDARIPGSAGSRWTREDP